MPSYEIATAILLLGFFALLFLGLPIAFALGISTLLTAFYIDLPIEAVLLKAVAGVDNFTLLAIPFFVLAGAIMAQGGIAWRLVNLANVLVGFVRGGLAMVNILSSMFFGGISGSAVADTTSIGSIMIPMMKKQGYDDAFSVNVTIASSTQGVVIPPSHNVIIYAYATGGVVSVSSLFLAGVIPGILIGLALMFLVSILAHKKQMPKGEMVPLRQAVIYCKEALLGLMTLVIIVAGVIGGVFTPTESAAIAVLWAAFVTYCIYRSIGLRETKAMLVNVLSIVAMVMSVIAFAAGFAYLMTMMQVPGKISSFILSISDNPLVLMLLINIMLLILGTFMDMAPLIMICTPILYPVITKLGIDPTQFGIIMMLNLGIGLVTPPVGTALFAGCAVGNVSMTQVSRGLLPFWLTMIAVLMAVTYIPALTLWLPSML
ncbi:hypothetical protein C9J01_22750 [Photobacterium rosenbergii]|uniref:TRAP transporter large permease protein n=1 Tax=Photobacterium rosenbergii TaxID=294936 RepID=A0A2T3N6Z0_9GAMM|nr:TRAP transporter large permease [Photobacterium rosenbergii]PSW08682.1 hypothetical protein C9J01_22750 [Photobacterium rosenbergii]